MTALPRGLPRLDPAARPWPGFSLAAEAAVIHLGQHVPGMDVWTVTHVEGERQVVVATIGHWSGLAPTGAVFSWADSFCVRMVDGRGPSVAPTFDDLPVYQKVAVGPLAQVRAYLGVPLMRGDDELFGTLCAFAGSPQPATLADSLPVVSLIARMLSTILAREQVAHERSLEAAEAYALAERDLLTGLRNRRGFETALDHEDQRCRRYGTGASILVVDLDELKAVNDGVGHAAGDVLLRRCSETLTRSCRPSDLVSRVGGDEYTVLAVETDVVSGRALAVRLRRDLRSAQVSASVGVATRRVGEGLTDTWARADEAMYAEKLRRRRARQTRATRG